MRSSRLLLDLGVLTTGRIADPACVTVAVDPSILAFLHSGLLAL